MKAVTGERWNYTLYSDGSSLYFVVVCGSVGIYEVAIELTAAENESYNIGGRQYLAELADTIRQSPDIYSSRNIKGFPIEQHP